MKIKRGEIFYINAGAVIYTGSEQYAGRPAVVVSNDKNNENSNVVEVVYMTTQPKTDLPTHVTVRSTNKVSTVLCEQVCAVSVNRLGSCLGTVTEKEMESINIAIMISLQLDDGIKAVKEYDKEIKEQQEEINRLKTEIMALQQENDNKGNENIDIKEDNNDEIVKLAENNIKLQAENRVYKDMYEQLLDKSFAMNKTLREFLLSASM